MLQVMARALWRRRLPRRTLEMGDAIRRIAGIGEHPHMGFVPERKGLVAVEIAHFEGFLAIRAQRVTDRFAGKRRRHPRQLVADDAHRRHLEHHRADHCAQATDVVGHRHRYSPRARETASCADEASCSVGRSVSRAAASAAPLASPRMRSKNSMSSAPYLLRNRAFATARSTSFATVISQRSRSCGAAIGYSQWVNRSANINWSGVPILG